MKKTIQKNLRGSKKTTEKAPNKTTKKSASELLEMMDRDKERRQKLSEIRKQREQLTNKQKIIKLQKRKVEIIEYEDGTFSLDGYAYSLPLQRNEVEFAFKSWLDRSLERGSVFESNTLLEKGSKLD